MTESSDTAGDGPPEPRVRPSRSSTTRVSRSTWAIAIVASSLTTSASSVSEISSSRMSRAVSGVRSWCEASAAKSRSAASDFVMSWARRVMTPDTWSISSMSECTGVRRASPAAKRVARWTSSWEDCSTCARVPQGGDVGRATAQRADPEHDGPEPGDPARTGRRRSRR